MTTSMILLQALLAAVYFGAGWLIRHVQAAPAGTTAGGVLGPILHAVEQQILQDLQSHIGSIVQLPTANTTVPAPK